MIGRIVIPNEAIAAAILAAINLEVLRQAAVKRVGKP